MIENISITPAARQALETYMGRMGPEQRVATILLAADVDASTELGRKINNGSMSPEEVKRDVDANRLSKVLGSYEWSVAFYLKNKIPSDLVVKIDGIEFFIDELWHERLDGATLDYLNGRFVVLNAP